MREQRQHFAELDGYRGIAALLVVIFHTYTYSSKGRAIYAGSFLDPIFGSLDGTVAWFFVLSGFLVSLPFIQAAIEQNGALSPRGFLVRRALRIVPVYAFAIVVMSPVLYTREPIQIVNLIEHLLFVHVFDSRFIFGIITPAWSVGVEVMLYLFLAGVSPLAYRAAHGCKTRRGRLSLVCGGIAALGALSLLSKEWVSYLVNGRPPVESGALFYGPLAKFDTFALGMLLAAGYVAVAGKPLFGNVTAHGLRCAGGALLIAIICLRGESPIISLYFSTLSGVGFALLLGSTVFGPRGSAWERALSSPMLRFLGLVSYSLYLWHEIVILMLIACRLLIRGATPRFPLGLSISLTTAIIIAAVSYWLIERPALSLRDRFTRDGRWIGSGKPEPILAAPPGD